MLAAAAAADATDADAAAASVLAASCAARMARCGSWRAFLPTALHCAPKCVRGGLCCRLLCDSSLARCALLRSAECVHFIAATGRLGELMLLLLAECLNQTTELLARRDDATPSANDTAATAATATAAAPQHPLSTPSSVVGSVDSNTVEQVICALMQSPAAAKTIALVTHPHAPYGYTPLHYAAHGGHADVISFLLRIVPAVDPCSLDGMTPLHIAAHAGRPQVIRNLLDVRSAAGGGVTLFAQTVCARILH